MWLFSSTLPSKEVELLLTSRNIVKTLAAQAATAVASFVDNVVPAVNGLDHDRVGVLFTVLRDLDDPATIGCDAGPTTAWQRVELLQKVTVAKLDTVDVLELAFAPAPLSVLVRGVSKQTVDSLASLAPLLFDSSTGTRLRPEQVSTSLMLEP